MRRRWKAWWIAALLMVPGTARGAGYGLYEQGGGALGASGAVAARVGDPTAIFFNPAGLARVDEGTLYGGVSFLYATREFAGHGPYPGFGVHETSPDEVFYPVAAYWGHPLGDRVTVGFGFYSPFGLSVEWEDPETFSGRFISTRVAITPFYFNPSVAFDVSPRLRIGGGVTAVHASVDLNRNVGQPNPTDFGPDVLDLGTVELDGSNGLDYGFNAGLQLDVTETAALGVTYRGGVETAIDGDADFTFTGTGTGLDPQLGPLFPEDQGVTTEIPFPAQLVVGFAVEVSESVVLEADLGWTRWSDLDQLSLRFEDPDLDEVIPQHWEDAFFLRTGAEIALRPGTDLRFGYYYDETPQITESVSPLLPDNDRHGFSAGVGWAKGRWRFDVFGLLLLVQDRETEGVNRDGFEGVYDSGTQIAGLSLGFRY